VGYVAAPAPLTAEFRKVHQFNVFTVNTPMQHGLAAYMQDPAPYLQLPAFYAAKRDLFRAGLAQTRFRLLPCEGTYFQTASYAELPGPERDWAKPTSASGSRASTAWPPFRWRPSTATASSSGPSAFASPSRTTPCAPRWRGWHGCRARHATRWP
jgi:hypothetical protein